MAFAALRAVGGGGLRVVDALTFLAIARNNRHAQEQAHTYLQRYDRDGDGKLSLIEFVLLCEEARQPTGRPTY